MCWVTLSKWQHAFLPWTLLDSACLSLSMHKISQCQRHTCILMRAVTKQCCETTDIAPALTPSVRQASVAQGLEAAA